jgi:hypothetical protein
MMASIFDTHGIRKVCCLSQIVIDKMTKLVRLGSAALQERKLHASHDDFIVEFEPAVTLYRTCDSCIDRAQQLGS